MTPTESQDDRIKQIRAWLEWATAQIDATLAFDTDAAAQLASAVYSVLDDPRLLEGGGGRKRPP